MFETRIKKNLGQTKNFNKNSLDVLKLNENTDKVKHSKNCAVYIKKETNVMNILEMGFYLILLQKLADIFCDTDKVKEKNLFGRQRDLFL